MQSRYVIAILSALLGLLGCGGDSDTTTSPDTTQVEPDSGGDTLDVEDDVSATDTDTGTDTAADTGERPGTPVYVTVASHLEDNFIGCCEDFEARRDILLQWADLFDRYEVSWNIQTMANFTEGIAECETDAHRAATNDRNVLEYLFHDRSIEFDSHGHIRDTSAKNLTDIRIEIQRLGDIPWEHLTVVGGFDSADQPMLDTFLAGEEPRFYAGEDDAPAWTPELLSFSAIPGHGEGEDMSGGMWNPTGLDHDPPDSGGVDGSQYYAHDPDQPIAIAGGGWTRSCQHGWRGGAGTSSFYEFWEESDAINALVDAIDAGEVPSGEMTAVTFYIRQSHITDPDTYIPQYESQLRELQANVEAGRIAYVHFQELIPIWSRDYDHRPNIIRTHSYSHRATCEDEAPLLPEDAGEVPEEETIGGPSPACIPSPCDPECEGDEVCDEPRGQCVPDCRVPPNSCPVPRPNCDSETGLCEP